MIELKNVTISFDGKTILKKLNLKIETGERVAIVGPSGCGKSTLLRLIMLLHCPDSGEILIDGVDITRLSQEKLNEVRKKYGMLFQSAALFDSKTIVENVSFPLELNTNYPSHEIKRRVKKALSQVEMSGRETDMPSDLSGGQKKRVGLARAIVNDPSILLYDEPTTGLDPVLSTNIEDLIVKLNNQLTATSVIVTHQISTILRTADRIYLMQNKKLLPPETPATIYNGQEAYQHFIRGGLDT